MGAKTAGNAAARATAEEESKAMTIAGGGALPAHLAGRMGEVAGKGVSTAQEDNLVPLIYVLQDNSPQCRKKDPAYIEGAEAGKIWMRNAAVPFADEIDFQPCFFSKEWVEWVPRSKGGGIVARHPECPKNAVLTEVEEDGNVKEVWKLPNGNEVVETRYHSGFVLREGQPPLPYTIPLKSTGHTVSKAWMFMMNSKLLPDNKKAPSFACVYKLRTVYKTKNNQSWWMFEINDADTRWVETVEDFERGLALHEAFASGEKKNELDEDAASAAASTASAEI